MERDICSKVRSPDGLVIGEPGGWDSIVLGYKGSMRAEIRLQQAVGHSAGAVPGVCDTAIDAWIRVRESCRQLSRGDAVFDTLSPTLLGLASGSDGMDEWSVIKAAFRLPPGLDVEQMRASIQEAVHPGTITFAEADEAFRAPRTTSLVTSFVRALRAGGAVPRFKVKTGTSDMNVVAPVWKCPTVAYGPGDSSLDHTPNEHIDLQEYLRSVRILTQVFEEWGQSRSC